MPVPVSHQPAIDCAMHKYCIIYLGLVIKSIVNGALLCSSVLKEIRHRQNAAQLFAWSRTRKSPLFRLMPAPPFVICATRACICVCVRNASVGTHTHTYKRYITIWIGASVDKINDNDQYVCSYSFYALFLSLAPLR